MTNKYRNISVMNNGMDVDSYLTIRNWCAENFGSEAEFVGYISNMIAKDHHGWYAFSIGDSYIFRFWLDESDNILFWLTWGELFTQIP